MPTPAEAAKAAGATPPAFVIALQHWRRPLGPLLHLRHPPSHSHSRFVPVRSKQIPFCESACVATLSGPLCCCTQSPLLKLSAALRGNNVDNATRRIRNVADGIPSQMAIKMSSPATLWRPEVAATIFAFSVLPNSRHTPHTAR